MSKEPLYPHVPKKKEPLFPHMSRGRVERLMPSKEAWQMTKGEVYDKAKELLTPGAEGKPFTAERTDLLNKQVNYHKQLVQQALSEGKPVPPEVLKDYPDLAKAEYLQSIDLLASTEGDPIRKFCCRLCGECAPKELLEEGRFPDRIAWLRSHYKVKHPGMWGKMSPMTIDIEGAEPVSPEYRYLASWVSEPLPEDAY